MQLKLTQPQTISLVEHTVLVAFGAAATYLLAHIHGSDFGVWTPLVVAVCSVVANVVNKVVSNNVEG